MAVWTAYDTVGAKEDVSDVITTISPTKTPFQASIGSEKIHQKNPQWQEDALRAQTTNAKTEGFTAVENAPAATTMRSNYTQILSETIKVSGSSDGTDYYGRARESAYQLSKSMSQVKRDFEYALVGSAQASVAGDNSGPTARKFASFQSQLLNGGSGVLDSDDFVAYTGGSSTLPTETNLVDVLQHVFEAGAEPSVIMVTPANSRTVADFAKASGRYRTIETGAKDRAIVNVVDLYVSPFGQQRVVLNRFLKAKNTLVYDPDMWKILTFRGWFRETLAKTGDNTMQMIVGEYSLKHKNFGASGAIIEAAGPTGF